MKRPSDKTCNLAFVEGYLRCTIDHHVGTPCLMDERDNTDSTMNTLQDWRANTAQTIVDMFFEAGARIGVADYRIVKDALTVAEQRGRDGACEHIRENAAFCRATDDVSDSTLGTAINRKFLVSEELLEAARSNSKEV